MGWGKRGRRVIISDEQGDKGQILRGTRTILRNREHEKTNVQFLGEQGNKPIYFRGTREQVPPPPGMASNLCDTLMIFMKTF